MQEERSIDSGQRRGKVFDIDRKVIRTEDLVDAAHAAMMASKAPSEPEAQNHLMDAEPGEGSMNAGCRLPPRRGSDNDV